MGLTDKKILSVLKQRHYKLTPQRRAVLKVLSSSQKHLTPADIYEKVQSECPGIGLVTIYRLLQILTELGLICEVHSGENCRRYIIRRQAVHHHHLICSSCGAVVDFSGCDLSELEERLSRETEFEMEGHLLEFYGHCRRCQMIVAANKRG
ncbi:MAG: transcriptional repressor [Chloroflexi bacterium]|nr:MAG: transcriptional repressor [Chloroflexota bacterium]